VIFGEEPAEAILVAAKVQPPTEPPVLACELDAVAAAPAVVLLSAAV
jgi:hypothetical protein